MCMCQRFLTKKEVKWHVILYIHSDITPRMIHFRITVGSTKWNIKRSTRRAGNTRINHNRNNRSLSNLVRTPRNRNKRSRSNISSTSKTGMFCRAAANHIELSRSSAWSKNCRYPWRGSTRTRMRAAIIPWAMHPPVARAPVVVATSWVSMSRK